jgi:hypothetical protein
MLIFASCGVWKKDWAGGEQGFGWWTLRHIKCLNLSKSNLLIHKGVVHANVGQKAMPLTSSQGYLVPFFTYDELVTSRGHLQHTTMVVELPVPPAAWI